MAIRRLPDGRWRVDVEPVKGRRFRRIFSTKGEAQRYEAHVKSQAYQPEWEPRKADRRKLSELADIWFDLHGCNLRDAARRRSRLQAMVLALKNPVACNLTPAMFARYRAARLDDGISIRTVNNDLTFLRAMFNQLHATQVIDYPNPLEQVKALSYQEKALSFLDGEQILELLHQCCHSGNPHVAVLVQVCLATGCRWSEAENLKPVHVQSGQLVFEGTKNGRVRSVPVSSSLVESILEHWKIHGPFTGSLTSFRRALARCSFQLPQGQASHILRHTFASHFVQQGGNLLVLQRILGHSTINMTMRYSHLAPDHLQEAVLYNPLVDFDTLPTHK